MTSSCYGHSQLLKVKDTDQISWMIPWIFKLNKLLCVIIICLLIGWVSSDSHLSDKAKIIFQIIGHLFLQPLQKS